MFHKSKLLVEYRRDAINVGGSFPSEPDSLTATILADRAYLKLTFHLRLF